ncbi:MAG: hypothetical protein V5A44_07890 [Haloarculaceae archaeon]
MSPTVHALRNEIRVKVGRFEREVSSDFTKEALAALCEAVGNDLGPDGSPSKARMRADILAAIGERGSDDPEGLDRSFRKAELQAIAEALREE